MRHNQLALMTVILMGLTACSIRIGLEPSPPVTVATMNPAPTSTAPLAPTEAALPIPASTPEMQAALFVSPEVIHSLAAPVAGGPGGVLLYAVHEPSGNSVARYRTTLMVLPLDEAGDPAGTAQVWYDWQAYDHAGMYALPDHSGVVEMSGFEAGMRASIIRPSADSWTIGPPVGSIFPYPLGWTLDSRGLLFAATLEGPTAADHRSAILLVRSDGVQVLHEVGAAGAALSPDGGTLVYSDYEGSNVEGTLWRLDIASGVAEQIAEEIVIDLAWSPDGQWIAGESNGRVYVIRPDGSGFQRVSDASTFEIYEPLQWSPSGDALLFTAYAGQAPLALQDPDAFAFQYNAYIADIGSAGVGEVRPVVPGSDAGYIDPSWSPDGQSILVVGPGAGSADVWLVRRDSQSVRQITFDGSAKRYPVWIVAGQ